MATSCNFKLYCFSPKWSYSQISSPSWHPRITKLPFRYGILRTIAANREMRYSRDCRSWMPRARWSRPSSLLLGPCNPCPWPIAWMKRVQGLRRRFKPETSDRWKYLGKIYQSPDALKWLHSLNSTLLAGSDFMGYVRHTQLHTYRDGKTKVGLGSSSGIKASVSILLVRSAKYKLAVGLA